ncbi:aminotransferase [Mycobacterium phage Tonenili]|uniref:Aminotransferase n=1 Tax=Mycobacterium phage Tonenili TaxID=1891703 RepID=A0A1C9EHH3_9CAUD|nr:aminotransferase [Mycobacterium phage Tonenili]AON96939.1 aminotransferase [Mycobacterium phage Tonenili]
MSPLEDALRKAIDEAIEPLLTDHRKVIAGAVDSPVAVQRADLHYVFDQYNTQLLDFTALQAPIGHSHPWVVKAIREHLNYYVRTGPPASHAARWPVEYARKLLDSLEHPDVDNLRVLYTEGESDATSTMVTTFTKWAMVRLVSSRNRLVDPDKVRAEVDRAREQGMTIVANETVTGFGRLGRVWGHQAYGFTPDVVIFGGPAGGGLSLGGLIGPADKLADVSTAPMAGAPLACATGAATLDALNSELLEHVREAGAVFGDRLRGVVDRFGDYLEDTAGVGLYHILDFRSPGLAESFGAATRQHGLLTASPVGSTVVVTPTLIASERELQRGVDLIAKTLEGWRTADL